jgi:competence ComEA-like helix-hairpin-helix protein
MRLVARILNSLWLAERSWRAECAKRYWPTSRGSCRDIKGRQLGWLIAPGLVAAVLVSSSAAPAAQDPLPEDAGKELVVTLCAACHKVDTVVARRRAFDEWRITIEGMVSRGAGGTDEELAVVLQYLTRHFGVVNVNAAPARELTAVLPVSADEADAIVRYRNERGQFADLDSFKSVPALRGKQVDEWKDRITFR